MSTIKRAVALYVKRGDKILIGKRKGGLGEGKWQIPGGSLEGEEEPLLGGARELEEETGMVLTMAMELDEIMDVQGDQKYKVHVILVSQCSGDPILTEPDKCYGWEWCDPKEIPQERFGVLNNILSRDKIKS